MEGHFAVTVPPGAGPGMQLNVPAPTGETLTVIVPAGVYAGSQFMVPLPQPKPQPKVSIMIEYVGINSKNKYFFVFTMLYLNSISFLLK